MDTTRKTGYASADELYRAIHERSDPLAALLIDVRDWYFRIAEFDKRTGLPLPAGLREVCGRIQVMKYGGGDGLYYDRLSRIVEHAYDAAVELFRQLGSHIRRDHAMLPIHAAKEVDQAGIAWLSRKPGRNIREKLASHPYVMAVKREMSFDQSENRLFKAFCYRLEELLYTKQKALRGLDEKSGDLLARIQRWLRSPECKEIGDWYNTPPNNTLLQHKHYRPIWDAWLWLQSLDAGIGRDEQALEQDYATLLFWTIAAKLQSSPQVRIPQQPCTFDYDEYRVEAGWGIRGRVVREATASVQRVAWVKGEGQSRYGLFLMSTGDALFIHTNYMIERHRFDEIQAGTRLNYQLEESAKGKSAKQVQFESESSIELFMEGSAQIVACIDEKRHIITISLTPSAIEVSVNGKTRVCESSRSAEVFANTLLQLLQLPMGGRPTSEHTPASVSESAAASLDLCSIQPEYRIGDRRGTVPAALIRQFWETAGEGVVELSAGAGNAVALLQPGVHTVSIHTLLSTRRELPAAVLSRSAMAFADELKNSLGTDALTYLVPDSRDDFELEHIRKGMNFYFKQAQPLPRSIASVFAWQASESFRNVRLREGDFVFVLDGTGETVTVTPIEAVYDPRWEAVRPENGGLTWERHPSSESAHPLSSRNLAVTLLRQTGCTFAEDVGSLTGMDILVDEPSVGTFVNDNTEWYTAPYDKKDRIAKARSGVAWPWPEWQELRGKQQPGGRTYLLAVGGLFESMPAGVPGEFHWIRLPDSLLNGVGALTAWQQEAGDDLPLWKDHLPPLSIRVMRDGREAAFALVKDSAIIPARGMKIQIPIQETFTLPEGHHYYYFDLVMGDGNRMIEYVAFLRSPAFPLAGSVECELRMQYTYGDDDPYQLSFIPLRCDDAPFGAVKAEWREKSSIAVKTESVAPRFPRRLAWDELASYPGKFGPVDLYDRIAKQFEHIGSHCEFYCSGRMDSGNRTRIHCRIAAPLEWRVDKFDKYYARLFTEAYGSIYLHEGEYEQRFDPYATELSFDLVPSRKGSGYNAKRITPGLSLTDDTVTRTKRGMRFLVLSLWDHGRSLMEPDAPDTFRVVVKQGVDRIVAFLEHAGPARNDVRSRLADEFFFVLCAMHKDAPRIVQQRLQEISANRRERKRLWRYIAYAIGDAQLDWQQQLLAHTLGELDEESIHILSLILWRDQQLVHRLDMPDLERVIQALAEKLERRAIGESVIGYDMALLSLELELLLALLRTRESAVTSVKALLTPESAHCRRFWGIVDDITQRIYDIKLVDGKKIADDDIRGILRSNIRTQVAKPESHYNTPDILYALRLYLTGNAEATNIEISSNTEEE
ncbi:DUF2357 domain-containing protein [Paenibacillus sabinae]|uniref:Cold-shock DNA-binding domain protein n=1 Tax=Paenibacillus sabinae T27 TaxID=1268072 RepID=X4ZDS5_9BACL|nr:DUF2357 domain-containing protein [Paenibacillus sabinae]AHV95637.1 Cold-shock DNA-binding domain protein [Paenibacillus sabinae T27]